MIVVGDLRHYDRLPPVGKLLTLVFGLAGRDRATELWIDYHPDPPFIQMWYTVDGVPYEMVPPPAEVWPELFAVLWEASGAGPPRRRWWPFRRRRPAFPDTPVGGTLFVRYGDTTVIFDVLFFRGRTGEHINMTKTTPADVTGPAGQFLRERFEKGSGYEGLSDPDV